MNMFDNMGKNDIKTKSSNKDNINKLDNIIKKTEQSKESSEKIPHLASAKPVALNMSQQPSSKDIPKSNSKDILLQSLLNNTKETQDSLAVTPKLISTSVPQVDEANSITSKHDLVKSKQPSINNKKNSDTASNEVLQKQVIQSNNKIENNPQANAIAINQQELPKDLHKVATKEAPSMQKQHSLSTDTNKQSVIPVMESKTILPKQDSLKISDDKKIDENLHKNINEIEKSPKINEEQKDTIDKISYQTLDLQNQVPQKDDIPRNTIKSPKLNIKDTLKYGAFRAFDAIGLLRPSDGKKLSEIIKKADELSININKIKYKDSENKVLDSKAQNAKNIILQDDIGNKNTLMRNSANKSIESMQNPLQEVLREDNKDIIKKDLNNKDSSKKENSPNTNNTSLQLQKNEIQEVGKGIVNKNENSKNENKTAKIETNTPSANTVSQDETHITESKINSDIKPASIQNPKRSIKENIRTLDQGSEDVKKTDVKLVNTENLNTLKNEQMQRNFDVKETMKSFVSSLNTEIQNYKPPISKITIELTPANLGSVEVSITHQGKNIQIQLHSNQNALNLLMQNHNELRSMLSQIGYENVAMSFSNGSSMSFSDGKGNWHYEEIATDSTNRNENSLDENELSNMEITIINNYA